MEGNKTICEPRSMSTEEAEKLEDLRLELTNLCRQFDLSGEGRYPGAQFSRVMLSQVRTLLYDDCYIHSSSRKLDEHAPQHRQVLLTRKRMYQMVQRSVTRYFSPYALRCSVVSMSRYDLLKTKGIPRQPKPHLGLSGPFNITEVIVSDFCVADDHSYYRTVYDDSRHAMFADCVIWLAELIYLLRYDNQTIGDDSVVSLIGRIDGLIKGLALIAAKNQISIKARSYLWSNGGDDRPDIHLYYPDGDWSQTGIMRDNSLAIRGFVDRWCNDLSDQNLCDWPH